MSERTKRIVLWAVIGGSLLAFLAGDLVYLLE